MKLIVKKFLEVFLLMYTFVGLNSNLRTDGFLFLISVCFVVLIKNGK